MCTFACIYGGEPSLQKQIKPNMAGLKGVVKLEASERAAHPYINYRRYNESF